MNLNILIILLCLINYNSYCQDIYKDSSLNTFAITGKIESSLYKRDTVYIRTFKTDVSNGAVDVIASIPDSNGKFKCIGPKISGIGRINIYIKHSGNLYINLEDYIVEKGDDIFISIISVNDKSFCKFSGKGAAKYECRNIIDLLGERIDSLTEKERNENYFIGGLRRRIQLGDSIIQAKYLILNEYKDKMDPLVYQVMRTDIRGEIGMKILLPMYSSAYISNLDDKQKLYDYYTEPIDTLNGEILALSPYYINYFICKNLMSLFASKAFEEDYSFPVVFTKSLRELYFKLRNEYSGPIRDMAILSLLTNTWIGNTNNDLDFCLKDALNVIQTSYVKDYVNQLIDRKTKGRMVYDFYLPDTSGKYIHLSDYKGKVILIDIWFTGCAGCRLMAKEIREKVTPLFRNNSDVVFISISGDKDKQAWLQSVKDEKYSEKVNINLYSEGKGFDHPFMQYYDFNGGPYLFIADKYGRIFNFSPPRNGDSISVLINQALLD